jgi:hypothetical protein
MEFDVIAVDDRRDSADRFSISARKETGSFGVLKKGVLLFAQEELHFALERWDPVGVSLVHLPRESDEFFFAARIGYLFNVHECSIIKFPSGNSEKVLSPVGLGLSRSLSCGFMARQRQQGKRLKPAGCPIRVSAGDRLREASGKFQPSPCRDFSNEN